MSIRDLNWALEQPTGGPGSKVVLLALANYSNENHESYPSIERLARETDQSVATVKRRIVALIEQGLILRTIRGGQGQGRMTNLYTLQHPSIAATAQAEPLGLGLKSEEARAQDEGGYGSTVSPQPNNQGEPKDVRDEPLFGDDATPTQQAAKKTTKSSSDALFDKFWETYPKHVAKKGAKARWDTLVLTKGVDPLAIISGAAVYARACRGSEPRFIKQPDGWLNLGRWEDEVPVDPAPQDAAYPMAFTEGPAPEPTWEV